MLLSKYAAASSTMRKLAWRLCSGMTARSSTACSTSEMKMRAQLQSCGIWAWETLSTDWKGALASHVWAGICR